MRLLSSRDLHNQIDLLMEPMIACCPRPIVRHVQIKTAENLGYKRVKFDQ
jgi:hypothetical protein